MSSFVIVFICAIVLISPSLKIDQAIFFTYATLGLIVLIIFAFMIRKHRNDMHKIRALDIAQVDIMNPLEFEKYVARLLVNRGFTNVRLTELYDYGVDIIAEKDGVRWGIQVKRYSSTVKAEAVRQVVTALIRYKCQRAMVVTNSDFSNPARVLADDNQCVLIDREKLSDWILSFQNKSEGRPIT